MNAQYINLYQPIINDHIGPPPISLRIGVTPNGDHTLGGVQQNTIKVETYVLLSALPAELQERVRTAIQMLISGM
jgi:hypothetical protein